MREVSQPPGVGQVRRHRLVRAQVVAHKATWWIARLSLEAGIVTTTTLSPNDRQVGGLAQSTSLRQ